MLPLSFFKNMRFTAASTAVTLTFFTMLGSLLVLTQYLQFVLGYSPLETGVRLLPWAIPMMIVSPWSAKLVERFGSKLVVAAGLTLTAVGFLSISTLDASSPYSALAWRFVLTSIGLALVMAPATDAIMGSVPLAKSGVGSAVNDTTRQSGGAVGVAVIGSVFASIYGSQIADAARGRPVPPAALEAAKDSVGAALQIAAQIPGQLGREIAATAKSAFLDGMAAGLYVGAGVALIGALIVMIWLPARARSEDIDRQTAEYEAARATGGNGGDGAARQEPARSAT
jgi:Na+/melibiose symporter-like transporter